MASILYSIGFNVLGKAYSIAIVATAYSGYSYLTTSGQTRNHRTKTFNDFKHIIDHLDDLDVLDDLVSILAPALPPVEDDDYDIITPVITRYEVCHTKVHQKKFSVITVITTTQTDVYTIRHMIVRDHIADEKHLLTAIKAPL
jgi:hypothetical protein